jgi:hypothetical protein
MSCKEHKIIIVGNSKELLKHKNGDKIDSFDYIVRVGSFRIKGYEEYIGKKTNLLCTIANLFCKSYVSNDILLGFDPGIDTYNFTDMLFLEYDHDLYREIMPHGDLWGVGDIPVPSAAAGDFYFKKIYKNLNKNHNFNSRILMDRFIQHLIDKTCIQNIFFYDKVWRKDFFIKFNSYFPNTKLSVPSKGMYIIDYIVKSFTKSKIYITGFDGFKVENYWRHEGERFFCAHSSLKEQYMLKKMLKEGIVSEL